MTSKLLIAINDLNDIKTLSSLGINNYAIPLKDFAIGYKNLFSFSDIQTIKKNVYIIVNRILNSKEIEDFKKILKQNLNIKGVIFADVGVFKVVKEINPNIELIWNIEHFGTNYMSINYWIKKGCKSAFIANEITLEQINEILINTNAPLVVQIFGYPIVSYSRRLLLSNYNKFYKKENNNFKIMQDRVSKKEFIFLENEDGTAVYNKIPFDGREILKLNQDEKIKYYFINYNFLKVEDVVKFIKNLTNETKFAYENNFLHKKTIYKIKEGKGV